MPFFSKASDAPRLQTPPRSALPPSLPSAAAGAPVLRGSPRPTPLEAPIAMQANAAPTLPEPAPMAAAGGSGSTHSSFDDIASLNAAGPHGEGVPPAQHADPWAAVGRVAQHMMSAVSSADDLASCMDALEGITAAAAVNTPAPNDSSFVGSATASAEPAEGSAHSEALSLVLAHLSPRCADAIAASAFRLDANVDQNGTAVYTATIATDAGAAPGAGAVPAGVSPLPHHGVAAAASVISLVSPSTPMDRLPEAVAYRVINGRALHAVLDGALADRESRARLAEAADRQERERRLAVGAVVGPLPEQPLPALAVASPPPPAPGARVASSILLTEEKMLRFVLALDQAQARDQLLVRFRGERDAITLRGTTARVPVPTPGPNRDAYRAVDDTVRAIAQSVASAAATALAAANATTNLVARAAAGPRPTAGAPHDAVRGLAIVAAAVAGGEGDRLRAMMAEDDAARQARRERMEQERLRMLGMLAQTAARIYNH